MDERSFVENRNIEIGVKTLLMETERYLGGLDSIQLGKGLFAGYGVYATNLRLFGVRRRRAIEPLEIGRDLGKMAPGSLSESQSSQIIRELEQKRDFEIGKDEITSIEMKKPPGVFRMGHLLIRLKSDQGIKVKIGKREEYGRLQDLIQAFHPEKVVEKP